MNRKKQEEEERGVWKLMRKEEITTVREKNIE